MSDHDDDLIARLSDAALIAFVVGVALVLLGLLARDCHASPRWSPAVASRLLNAWPDVEAAAEAAGVPAAELAAMAATETGAMPREGLYAPVLGVLQVRPSTWRRLLWGAGYDDSDLMHPVWGWYAAAEVLGYLRHRTGLEGARLHCVWSDGNAALSYARDCLYSREVARMRGRVGEVAP
jgi:hypothetical protein